MNRDGRKQPEETNPRISDTDGDGLSDGVEDLNLNGRQDPGETNPRKEDSDGDGLPDGLEDANRDGRFTQGETDPRALDTDADGIPDGIEDPNRNGRLDPGETDPRRADSDNDGLVDGLEDGNRNGVVDARELIHSPPTRMRTVSTMDERTPTKMGDLIPMNWTRPCPILTAMAFTMVSKMLMGTAIDKQMKRQVCSEIAMGTALMTA